MATAIVATQLPAQAAVTQQAAAHRIAMITSRTEVYLNALSIRMPPRPTLVLSMRKLAQITQHVQRQPIAHATYARNHGWLL